jgi:hypothetical protein
LYILYRTNAPSKGGQIGPEIWWWCWWWWRWWREKCWYMGIFSGYPEINEIRCVEVEIAGEAEATLPSMIYR